VTNGQILHHSHGGAVVTASFGDGLEGVEKSDRFHDVEVVSKVKRCFNDQFHCSVLVCGNDDIAVEAHFAYGGWRFQLEVVEAADDCFDGIGIVVV
jgi:hypothetical protein